MRGTDPRPIAITAAIAADPLCRRPAYFCRGYIPMESETGQRRVKRAGIKPSRLPLTRGRPFGRAPARPGPASPRPAVTAKVPVMKAEPSRADSPRADSPGADALATGDRDLLPLFP